MGQPSFVLLAGPNGAGKSTLYHHVIRDNFPGPFINADEIQRDELQSPAMAASMEAAGIAENRRRDFISDGKSFVSETVFSHPSKIDLVKAAKDAGFWVALFHISLASADLAVARVAGRVIQGGHNVPEHKIRERYARNGKMIREAVLIADEAYVFDGSRLGKAPECLIKFENGRARTLTNSMPIWASELYGQDLR